MSDCPDCPGDCEHADLPPCLRPYNCRHVSDDGRAARDVAFAMSDDGELAFTSREVIALVNGGCLCTIGRGTCELHGRPHCGGRAAVAHERTAMTSTANGWECPVCHEVIDHDAGLL